MLNKLFKKLLPANLMFNPSPEDGTPSVPDLIDSPFEALAFRVNEALRNAGFYEAEFRLDEKGRPHLEFLKENLTSSRAQELESLAYATLQIYYTPEK